MNRYGAPTTYKRIVPDRGCGFILKRIYELTEAPGLLPRPGPRKIDVYRNTRWYNRPGFASLLWSSLIKDGLIESDGGMQEYKCCSFFKRSHIGTRAAGHYAHGIGYTVRYHLTPKGRGVLFDMMARVNKIREKKDEEEMLFPLPTEEQKQWLHNWIAGLNKTQEQERKDKILNKLDTGRVLNTVGSVAEYDAEKDLKELEKLADSPPPEILQKEALDCAKLAADYVGENQKLRAEKDNLNERLKKIAARLEWLDNEISIIRNGLAKIIGQ